MAKVAIVGRVNVGKSTLFNRLTETNRALVSRIPQTTRDKNYGTCHWRGFEFTLIDTGGIIGETPKEGLEKQVRKQVEIALKEAALVIFVIDGKEGRMPTDRTVASLLKKTKSPVILVANKIDGTKIREEIDLSGFLKLGFGPASLISAVTGSGTGDLLDRMVEKLKEKKELETKSITPEIKVAIIGKPNVGKSSLLNALLKEQRVIVSETPFTTREPQDTLTEYDGHSILLIDTVGLRRKTKVAPGLERVGAYKSLHIMRSSDFALFVIDPFVENISHQDLELARLLVEHQKTVIVIVNKWDLAEDKISKFRNFEISNMFPHISFAPVLFVSAKTNYNIQKIFELIIKVNQERKKIIPQDELNAFLKWEEQIHKATIYTKFRKKKILRISRIRQLRFDPPVVLLEKNTKEPLPKGFQGFIEKRFRERFGFLGTPIQFKIKKRE